MRILSAVALAACATTQPPPPTTGPRGLRASEHITAARDHDEQATRRMWPDPLPLGPGASAPEFPWFRSWDTSAEHARAAGEHRAKASELHAAYVEACNTRPFSVVSISPLARYATGGWNTATGAIMYLAPQAGDPDRLLADLKCHRAWMMLAPANMDDCPLDLPGLVLDARGDAEGVTVSIGVRDPKLVDELQRRVAVELESAARRHARDPR